MFDAIKDIHIGCCSDADGTARSVGYGLGLAQAAGAHVTVQVASNRLAVPGSLVGDAGASLVADENARLRTRAGRLADTVLKDAMAQGRPCTSLAVHLPFRDLVSAVARQSRLHDMTILDAKADALSLERALLEEVLFECGRPVLLVPADRETFRLGHAMVAWDGSPQAARALHDALPLLAGAETVSLVSVTEPGKPEMLPGSDLAPHLDRHGIDVTLVDLDAADRDVERALRDHSHARRTDLIVMGAYAHSWWREIVLGGVTRSFLSDPPAPLFLAH